MYRTPFHKLFRVRGTIGHGYEYTEPVFLFGDSKNHNFFLTLPSFYAEFK